MPVSHYSVISRHRYLWDPWDTIGTPSGIRLKTHLPEVLKMSTLNCLGSECGANVFCSKLPIKKTKRKQKGCVVLFFLSSLFSPFFSPPRISEPPRITKRAQVFIDRIFKKVWLTCISTKMIESNFSLK